MPKTQAPAARGQTQGRGGTPARQQQQTPRGGKSLVSTADDSSNLPAHLQDYVGKGMEQMGSDDLARPRLKLLQALSPELQEFNDARAGDFLHTSAGRILSGPLLVTPIFVAKRFLLWNPRDAGGGILARSDDGVTWSPPNQRFDVKLDKKDGGAHVTWETAERVDQSRLAEWGTMNPDDPKSPPAATKLYDYVFGFPEFPDLEPAVFSFQRSSWKVGRNLNTNIKTAIARRPMFTLAYMMDSIDDNNASNQDFKNVSMTANGHLTDMALIEEYRQVYDSLVTSGLKIKDEDSLQAEGERMGQEERDTAPAKAPQDLRRQRR